MNAGAVSIWANLLGYQAVWFVAVWGASRGLAGPAVIAAVLFAAWQLASCPQRGREVRLILVAIMLGALFDGALAAADVVRYAAASPALPPGGAPLWILALWVAFALTLNRALRWLMGRPLLSALLGAIAGPLAYAAAGRLGAATFVPPVWHAVAWLALGWGVSCTLLSCLAAHWARPPHALVQRTHA